MKLPLQALMRVLLMVVVLVMVANIAQAQKRRFRVGYKDEGFSFIPEASVLIPSNTYDFAFNLNAIFGGQFGPRLFAGAGVGIDAYESDVFLPAFADVRYFVLDGPVCPYGFLEAGYSLPIDVNPLLSGGPMINPGVGLKFFMTRTTAVNLALGYRYQSMPVNNESPDASTALRTNFIQSIGVRLGMQF